MAGLQRARRVAADGNRRLQSGRADAVALYLQRRQSPGSERWCRPRASTGAASACARQQMEFKRATSLSTSIPVGVGAMTIATIVSISLRSTACSERRRRHWRRSSRWIVGGVRSPRLADRVRNRRQILHRTESRSGAGQNSRSDPVCFANILFEPEDMASCPAYAGPICLAGAARSTPAATISASACADSRRRSRILSGKRLLQTPIYARINSHLDTISGVFAVRRGLVGLTNSCMI